LDGEGNGVQWAPGQKPRAQTQKTKWRRWAQTQKQNSVVGPKLENKMAPGFRLEEVGILSGWSMLLKRIAL